MGIVAKFEKGEQLDTPVLFLVYRRLDTVRVVFESIRKAKPKKLYIAGDGPKHAEEEKLVNSVRNYILENIDWNCEVRTLFREKNLGSAHAVSQAISWFFENEKQGIILEDDVVPTLSFFWFCQELLEKYEKEKKIWEIGGVNFLNGLKERQNEDYYFSALGSIWGWATWKDRWEKFDLKLEKIENAEFLKKYWKGKALRYWEKVFWTVKKDYKLIDAWDYQWKFTIWKNEGLCILPKTDMVENIGFGELKSHTIHKFVFHVRELKLEKHPKEIRRDLLADYYVMYKIYLYPKKGRMILEMLEKFIERTGLIKLLPPI